MPDDRKPTDANPTKPAVPTDAPASLDEGDPKTSDDGSGTSETD